MIFDRPSVRPHPLCFNCGYHLFPGGDVTIPFVSLEGQEADEGFLRRAGSSTELLQVHGETQGDVTALFHQTPPLQSLQLPQALQIAPRHFHLPHGPPCSQGNFLLLLFDGFWVFFSQQLFKQTESPSLTMQTTLNNFSLAFFKLISALTLSPAGAVCNLKASHALFFSYGVCSP